MIFGDPVKCGVLFNIGNYRTDYVEKCSDETVVEICTFYECLHISNACRGLLIFISFNFLRVYVDAFSIKD